VAKTLCRLGHRLGYIPEDITAGFEMPRVPRTIIPMFSDGQLEALLAAPDKRTWVGIRDRAIMLVGGIHLTGPSQVRLFSRADPPGGGPRSAGGPVSRAAWAGPASGAG